jgi:hypothetical protein
LIANVPFPSTDMSSLRDLLIESVLFSTDMSSLRDFLSATPYRKLKHTVNKVSSLRDLLSANVTALSLFGRGFTSAVEAVRALSLYCFFVILFIVLRFSL